MAAVSPLPGWTAIPTDFEARHRPSVEQMMTAMCKVLRVAEGPAPYPEPEGWDGTVLLWAGLCRLQVLKREVAPTLAGQPSQLRQYLVGLPFENREGVELPALRTGERGDIVRVRGRDFMLKQSMAGSILFANDFIAWENQTQQNP